MIAKKERFTALLKRHEKALYEVIKYKIWDKQAVEEVYQQTLATGWERFDQLRNDASFLSWMISIALNSSKNMQEKKGTFENNNQQFIEDNRGAVETLAESFDPARIVLHEEEAHVADTLFRQAPEHLRTVYGLYHAGGHTMAQIAEMLGIGESTVRQRLETAQAFFTAKLKRLLVGYLVFQLGQSDVSAMTDRALTHLPGTTAGAMGGSAGVASVLKQGTSFLVGLATSLLTFMWLLGTMICFQFSGTAIIRNAPTLSARRWLVRQFLFVYAFVLAIPLYFLAVSTLNHYKVIEWNIALGCNIFCILFGTTTAIYLIAAPLVYRHLCRRKMPEDSSVNDNAVFFRLEKFVRRGLAICLFLVVLILGQFAWVVLGIGGETLLQPSKNSELFIYLLSISILVATFFIVVHLRAVGYFRFALNVSRDEESFRSYSMASIMDNPKARLIYEIACVGPFALYGIVPNIIHLIVVQSRPALGTFELIGFTACWIATVYWNIKDGKRWRRITFLFAFQVLVMEILRYYAY